VHLKGANSMAESGFSFRKILVSTGWAISLLLCTNGGEKTTLSPCTISGSEAFFFPSLDKRFTAKSCDY